MPPRYAYWTIVAGALPTAFRAADREELLPTFKRLKAKHPDAVMKYFARGRLWASPDDAKRDALARRAGGGHPAHARGRNWRPGGEHTDPRQKYKDAKKERNLGWRKQRFERRQRASGSNRPANGSTLRSGRIEAKGRPPDRKPFGHPPPDQPPRDRKPFGSPARDKPPRPFRPVGGPLRGKRRRS
jgi:hypothetical protein